jgi:hypothetical protein
MVRGWRRLRRVDHVLDNGVELIDPVGRHWSQGADGESFTARELRRAGRSGWRTVHNLTLEGGDIDHIVTGPGGVVAIETKHSDAEWHWLQRRDIHRRWVRQATDSARRARALVRQHAGVHVDVRPIVVAWVRGFDDEVVEVDGVRVVHGSRLADVLTALDETLTPQQADRIHQALMPVAERMDRHWAARTAAPARAIR